ncbi:MAG: PocR ligand-binding domain-containing protein [Lachnospiraceae bacterium]|nr:PocR ligand-binding domain-containing protein [Lachnospiraceae bacterium]
MEKELYLTDLIEQPVLQKIQDAFSDMVGMAALTTDATGKPVTEGSNFTDYCMKYTRKSKTGCARCEECDRYGAVMTGESGKPTSYECHSGLIDFAAPIMANGKMVGSFIGGQVLTEKPDPEKIRKVAEEIGVGFDEYWDAISRVQIIPKEKIDKATDFLFTVATVLSDMAMSKHQVLAANIEIEKAARMKTDFLANMSHEIRTPMNAVIGMAEMALREDIPDNAREYINQIKSSGRALLAIINDILDFSKIESGKMDILPVNYEPMSLFNDVTNIIMTRLVDKDVELDLDIAPDIPVRLCGDNIRIRQVLINLANNAVKFTNKGQVRIKVDFETVEGDKGLLKVDVIDTGIGIKKENLKNIFESFRQLDSTRNRNVEGTGLGLAITRLLIGLMDGSLSVESEYGWGSKFSFVLPQRIVDPAPAMSVKDPGRIVAAGVFRNHYIADNFIRDTERLHVKCFDFGNTVSHEAEYFRMRSREPEAEFFLFMDQESLDEKWDEFIKAHREINVVIVSDFVQDSKLTRPNMMMVKKPLSCMNLALVFNKEKIEFNSVHSNEDDADFIAPEGNILIVDDNMVNLAVAEGLMEPLKIHTVTATCGREAIKKAAEFKFDIILMDHMMPEMDGIEAARLIREGGGVNSSTPIIALTANAVGNAKEMFLESGMDDFIPKPVEVRTLITKIKNWLPEEKVIRAISENELEEKDKRQSAGKLVIGDLDTEGAIEALGNEKLFMKVLKEYYRVIGQKSSKIRELFEAGDWQGYTIELHALKSASRQIGARQLGDMAAELERAGKENDTGYIRENSERALTKYLSYSAVLAPYFKEEEPCADKKEADPEEIRIILGKLSEAAEDLDPDRMEELADKLMQFSFPEEMRDYPERIKNACEELDVDIVSRLSEEWRALL